MRPPGFRRLSLWLPRLGVQSNTVLSVPQKAVYEFMRDFEEKERFPASTRVIAKGLGYRSQNSVIKLLHALAKKDLVEQLADRSWVVKRECGPRALLEVPIYGTIAAGLPDSAEQEQSEKIAIDPTTHGLSPRKKYWALRVRGDSMADAHIVDGDIAILEQREAHSGEIVAALVDSTTTTLKRYIVEGGRAILRAANPRYRDLEPVRLECQGVMVSLVGRGKR
jgi:repressor LexA